MIRKILPSKIMKGIKFFCVEDLTKILDLTPGAVRDYLRKGKIASIKVGLRFWVSEKNLNDFLFCKGIRNLPDDQFIEMINEAVGVKFKEWTKKAIPLMQKVVADFLVEKEKEKFNENIKKVDAKNKQLKKVLPEKVMEHLQDRTKEVKKEFEKVK